MVEWTVLPDWLALGSKDKAESRKMLRFLVWVVGSVFHERWSQRKIRIGRRDN